MPLAGSRTLSPGMSATARPWNGVIWERILAAPDKGEQTELEPGVKTPDGA